MIDEGRNGVTRREFDELLARVVGLENRERDQLKRDALLMAASGAAGALLAAWGFLKGFAGPKP